MGAPKVLVHASISMMNFLITFAILIVLQFANLMSGNVQVNHLKRYIQLVKLLSLFVHTELVCGYCISIGPINSNCPTAGSCIPQTYDVNGFECSSVCPQHCLPGEIVCDAEFDENGCKREDYCYPENYNFEGHICPSQCEANCKPDEIRCDAKVFNGCPERDYCVPAEYTNGLGEVCPGVCEITRCGDNEKVCPGGEDDRGCRQMDFCYPENGKYISNNIWIMNESAWSLHRILSAKMQTR